MINKELLKEYSTQIGVELDDLALERFDIYAQRLVRWNEHTNLTAITDSEGITIKHFLDSLYPLKYISLKDGDTLVDVGCGAGFPSMPLLMAKPNVEVSFVDSVGKKLSFIKDVLLNTGLVANIEHARAEELGKNDDFRETYDVAVARAVAPLNILCEYCLPLVKVDGTFISLKGSNGKEELEQAKNAIKVLGGKLECFDEYCLPNGDSRSVVVIKKISQTPTKYPRKSKKIDTRPL